MVTFVIILAPIAAGYIVMKWAGAGAKDPKQHIAPDQNRRAEYEEAVTDKYYKARKVGVQAVTSLIQIAGITAVLVIGFFDKISEGVGVNALQKPGWGLISIVECLVFGVFALAANYFGHYFDAHAEVYSVGKDASIRNDWLNRANHMFDFALLSGITSGVSLLSSVTFLVLFWFETTKVVIF